MIKKKAKNVWRTERNKNEQKTISKKNRSKINVLTVKKVIVMKNAVHAQTCSDNQNLWNNSFRLPMK